MHHEPVSVVIPAFNEEKAVGPEVRAVARVLQECGIPHEIIVVDDGSNDATAERAALAGARVLRHLENRGYGASIKSGIRAARHEAIVITDADGTYPPEEIPELLRLLETSDMAVGARSGAKVHIPLARRPAKWVLGRLANQVAGRRIPDLNSGLRAFRRTCVEQYFPILSNRFSFTTTVTLALLADEYRVVYHRINYHARTGTSKVVARNFVDFMILVLRMAMFFEPLRVFLPLAAGFACAGIGKAIFDVYSLFPRVSRVDVSILYLPALSTSALLLLLTALQLLMVGLVADGVLRRLAQHQRPLVRSHGMSHELPEAMIEPVIRQVAR